MTGSDSDKKVTVGAAVDPWVGDRLQKVADIGYNGNKSKAFRELLEAVLSRDLEKKVAVIKKFGAILQPHARQLDLDDFTEEKNNLKATEETTNIVSKFEG